MRRFDDAEEEFVSLGISVDMRSDREVDEQTVTEIADTLLAAI